MGGLIGASTLVPVTGYDHSCYGRPGWRGPVARDLMGCQSCLSWGEPDWCFYGRGGGEEARSGPRWGNTWPERGFKGRRGAL